MNNLRPWKANPNFWLHSPNRCLRTCRCGLWQMRSTLAKADFWEWPLSPCSPLPHSNTSKASRFWFHPGTHCYRDFPLSAWSQALPFAYHSYDNYLLNWSQMLPILQLEDFFHRETSECFILSDFLERGKLIRTFGNNLAVSFNLVDQIANSVKLSEVLGRKDYTMVFMHGWPGHSVFEDYSVILSGQIRLQLVELRSKLNDDRREWGKNEVGGRAPIELLLWESENLLRVVVRHDDIVVLDRAYQLRNRSYQWTCPRSSGCPTRSPTRPGKRRATAASSPRGSESDHSGSRTSNACPILLLPSYSNLI